MQSYILGNPHEASIIANHKEPLKSYEQNQRTGYIIEIHRGPIQ